MGTERASRGLIGGLGRRWRVGNRFKGAAKVWVGKGRSGEDYKSKWRFGSWFGGKLAFQWSKLGKIVDKLVDRFRGQMEGGGCVFWKSHGCSKNRFRGQREVCGQLEV